MENGLEQQKYQLKSITEKITDDNNNLHRQFNRSTGGAIPKNLV